jgi:metal-responsive CopG/Arc/MetJ family transcriptional regulator
MSAVLSSSGSSSQKVQTTLRLPKRLYEQVNCFVEKNRADSVNEFIVAAVAAYVKAMHRKIIDEAFVRMSERTIKRKPF